MGGTRRYAAPSRHPKIMLATVGGALRSVVGLIPIIRELVDQEAELLLRSILEEAVGLSGNGKPTVTEVAVAHAAPSGTVA